MIEPQKIKFGVLCNSLNFESWEAACLNHLLQYPDIELKLLVINQEAESSKPSFLNKLRTYPYTSFLYRFYKRFLLKANSFQVISFEKQFEDIPRLFCTVHKKGKYSAYFDEMDVAQIKEQKLDFMLRFGFNIIKGDILQSCKYGIWSFHHADNDYIRGGPIGFWEIYLKRNTTAVVLQQLNDQLDQGKILRKGYLKTINHSYKQNIDQLTEMAAIWPLQVCIDILNKQDTANFKVVQKTKAQLYKYPTNWRFIYFLLILLQRKIYFHFEQLFLAESWQVARFEGGLDDINKMASSKPGYISSPTAEYYCADPFWWPNDKAKLILFEYYSYQEQTGKIAMCDYNGNDFKLLDFGSNVHRSYPFCFTYEQHVYCLPEQAEAGVVSLYQIESTGKVKKYHDLIVDFDARDASLIFYNEKWWLFCTKANYFENAALFIFYSEALDQTFKPHANNPVKVDVQNARPAGPLIIKGNTLIRPAQNSAAHYGHQVNINSIKKLTTLAFEEEIIQVVDAKIFGKFSGIHHISSQNGQTLIDLKRSTFSFNNFKHQLKRKWRKITGSV